MARIQEAKKGNGIPLTSTLSDLVSEQLQESLEFRKALLSRAVGCMLEGDVEVGKSLLRKYVNGTIGFIALGHALGKSSKTLMQMLGPKGNPHIRNFFDIVAYLQKVEGAALEVVDRNAA